MQFSVVMQGYMISVLGLRVFQNRILKPSVIENLFLNFGLKYFCDMINFFGLQTLMARLDLPEKLQKMKQ